MKIRKLFSVLIFLLLVGIHSPLCAEPAPSFLWYFTSGHINPFITFSIWAVSGSPAIGDDGTFYAGSCNGYFFALYPNGDLKWVNADLGGAFAYTPAIADDGIIYASNGHGLFAFDPYDGKVLWENHASCLFLGAPAIAKDGTVFIGSNDNKLYAFSRTLEFLWDFQGHEISQPDYCGVFGNPVIGLDGTIYCVQNKVHVDPVSGDTTVEYSYLHTITPNGNHWGPWFWGEDSLRTDISPAIAGGRLYVAGFNGRLYSVSTAQFEVNWSAPMEFSTPTGAPVIGADGTVYAAYWNQIYGLNPTDGTQLWTGSSPRNLQFSTPAIGADGNIYVGTWGNMGTAPVGELCVFSPPDSSPYWDFLLTGQIHSSPAIVKSGNQGVLCIGQEYAFSAWNVYSPGIAHSPWPVDRGNLKRNARASYSVILNISALKEMVYSYNFPSNFGNSLASKLEAAVQSLEKEKVTPAKNQLGAFINEVNALKGKKIMVRDADRLISSARRIVDFL